MPTPVGQDIQTPIDPTGFASLDGATLLQLFSGLAFADDIGGNITTLDVAGNPTVPNAATTTKWQRYLWRRVGAASIGIYVWNPNAASDATYLRWVSINVAGIAPGSIVNSMIADNTITDAKIASVDWSKVINQPAFIKLSENATGDLAGSTYANLTIAGGVVSTAKLANSAVTVDKLATDAVETVKIKDQNVTTAKIADSNVTAVKMAENSRMDINQYAAGVFAAGVYSVTLVPAATAYTAGMRVTFKADTLNTGATDINVNGLGVKNLFKNVTSELTSGDIPLNAVVEAVYDGTNFQMVALTGLGGQFRASCMVTGRGTNGVCTIAASLNIASVTRSAQGVYDVLFTNALGSTNYGIVFGSTNDIATGDVIYYLTKASGGFTVNISTTSASALKDPTEFSFIVF